MLLSEDKQSEILLEKEISGIQVEHIALNSKVFVNESIQEGYKTVFLFFKGKGTVIADDKNLEIEEESILLPNDVKNLSLKGSENEHIHYLKISSKMTEQDVADLEQFPEENTKELYFAKFSNCEAYTETFKNPNTVSRTLLPSKHVPRVAMGTVEANGQDIVGSHRHPMLEQLFFGLSGNQCIVYADDEKVEFPENSLLHIPLGSNHSVEVKEGEKMYYIWLDFFMDSKGEEFLDTHTPIKE